MKKILALSLALLMVFSIVPLAMVNAEEATMSLVSGDVTAHNGKYFVGVTSTLGTADDDYLVKATFGSSISSITDKGFYIRIAEDAWNNMMTYNPTKIEVKIGADASFSYRFYASDASYASVQDATGTKYAAAKPYGSNKTTATTITLDLTKYPEIVENNYRYLYFYPQKTSAMNFYVYSITAYYEKTETETDGETTDAIATADKASIRLNEVNGIRFSTTVDTDKLAALGTVTEIGTLIGPKNIIGDYLTMDDVTAENAVAVEYGVDNDLWEGNQFVGSIVNVKDENLNREFVARGYVKVGDTYYYSSTTSTRTLAGVADSCIADTAYYSTLDTDTQALVNTWAAAND